MALLAGSAQAQWNNPYTLLTNGPASNRVNLVFLSEGYTNSGAQTNLFLNDCSNALAPVKPVIVKFTALGVGATA